MSTSNNSKFKPILREMKKAYFQSQSFKGKSESRKQYEKMMMKGLIQFLDQEAENINIELNYSNLSPKKDDK